MRIYGGGRRCCVCGGPCCLACGAAAGGGHRCTAGGHATAAGSRARSTPQVGGGLHHSCRLTRTQTLPPTESSNPTESRPLSNKKLGRDRPGAQLTRRQFCRDHPSSSAWYSTLSSTVGLSPKRFIRSMVTESANNTIPGAVSRCYPERKG